MPDQTSMLDVRPFYSFNKYKKQLKIELKSRDDGNKKHQNKGSSDGN